MAKFSEIPYVRLEYKVIEKNLISLISEFKNSKSAAKAVENFNNIYSLNL